MNTTSLETSQPPTQSATTVFVGRQPIYNRDSKTHAYELLFRSDEQNRAEFVDGERATAQLLLNTFAEIGLERIVGKMPAFINVPEEFILKGNCFALPKDRVVIEVLEDVRPTKEVVEELAKLREEGYTIALDDFVYSPELMPLVEQANIIKVDLPLVPQGELATHVELLRRHDLKLLAEKVETREEFENCKALGFDYFQGYFFCKPSIIKGKKTPINRVTMMRLIAKFQSPSVSLDDISGIVQTEPVLAYKLLRYVNSACCGLTHKVESIKHAVTLVGIRQVKTIANLTVLAEAAQEKPSELIQTVLVRAKMAELLANGLRQTNTDSFFLVGLFSALDALLDVPMEQALEMVPVSKEVRAALATRTGKLGMVLSCVLDYEKGNWDQVSLLSVDDEYVRDAYLQAIEWANDSLASVPLS